jgi:carbonic anhydrase/acetyltransferase-like protein (isoleucine patch superfamily)
VRPENACYVGGYNPPVLRPYRSIHPRGAPTAFIDQSAQVIGDVVIGDDSGVWMNAVLRGDVNSIRIGRRTNIQDGCVVHVMSGTHPTTLGDEVTVGHGALLHGCTVEDRCLISMGAIVLNGATIGRESIIAAGSVVVEGYAVPPGSLVMGSPGRIRRALTQDEVASIQRYAAHYVEYKAEYSESSP